MANKLMMMIIIIVVDSTPIACSVV